MRILIVETSSISKTSKVVVHIRNSLVITEHLNLMGHNCRLVSEESDITDTSEQFDYIIFVSATFYFKFQKFLELINNQKNCKLGWISNEIDNFQNDFLKQIGTDFIIANYEEAGVKKAHRHTKYLMTNLNALQARLRNPTVAKKHDVCYYGTFRKWREKYFQKYLVKDMILSTSTKNIKKFLLSGCDCWLNGPFSWEEGEETLNSFKSSLYIEDTITHRVYNHLANRFYEGLFCNCMILFDKSCLNTIKRSGYSVDDYFLIDSYDEIADKVCNVDQNLLEDFLSVNTRKALCDKITTLKEIEQFLVNY